MPSKLKLVSRPQWPNQCHHEYHGNGEVTNRYIEEITKLYYIDENMFFTPPNGTRCKHVFACALKVNSKEKSLGYNLFQTYDCPEGSNVLEMLLDTRGCKVSRTFVATGKARYFTPRWQESLTKKSSWRFLDDRYPRPHNITELALDEMWGLYGTDVEIAVIVNMGPGNHRNGDYRNIARKLSGPDEAPAGDSKRDSPVAHPTNFSLGADKNVSMREKLRRDEEDIEDDVRKKIRKIYPHDTPPYYRLGHPSSAPGTARNQ